MYFKEINIKNRVYKYYFGNIIKAKRLETKIIIIDEKNYKDLRIPIIRHVHWKLSI